MSLKLAKTFNNRSGRPPCYRGGLPDQRILDYYQNNFAKHGVHENSLGWTKGKQFLRFFQLTKYLHLKNARLIDVGCGFGDINDYLSRHEIKLDQYLGIDIVPEFIKVARQKRQSDRVQFLLGNYLELKGLKTDCTVASGIFSHRLFDEDKDQYSYLNKIMQKAFVESSQGIAFDFLSDKVEFRSGEQDFHASPSIILDIGYQLSRNVILDNSAMPFEFTITLFRDDGFQKEKTVFNKFLVDQEINLGKGKL